MTTALGDLRLMVAAALAADTPAPPDATVHSDTVDAVSPPAYLLVWGNPWLVPATFCMHTVRLDVVCVAGRIDPAPGIETLEVMINAAIGRLRVAGLPEVIVQPPAPFVVGGVTYLAARLTLEVRIPPAPAYVPPVGGGVGAVWDDSAYTYDGDPVA